jgi:hypothetical protein
MQQPCCSAAARDRNHHARPTYKFALALLLWHALTRNVSRCAVKIGALCWQRKPAAEYNVWVDPEAARIVCRSQLLIDLIGWRSGCLICRTDCPGPRPEHIYIELVTLATCFDFGGLFWVQCRMLGVSASGYYQHMARRRNIDQRRHLSDEALLVHMRAIYAEARGAYGWPRISTPASTNRLPGTPVMAAAACARRSCG